MRISSSCQKIQFHHLGANKWANSLGISSITALRYWSLAELLHNKTRTVTKKNVCLVNTEEPPPPLQNREQGREVRAPYRGCWNLIKHPSKQPQRGKKEINYVSGSRYTAGRAHTLKGNLFILYHYRELPLTCCGTPVTKVLCCPEVSERTACQVATNDGVHQLKLSSSIQEHTFLVRLKPRQNRDRLSSPYIVVVNPKQFSGTKFFQVWPQRDCCTSEWRRKKQYLVFSYFKRWCQGAVQTLFWNLDGW